MNQKEKKIKLTNRAIDILIYGQKTNHRFKYVTNPSAQTASLCAAETDLLENSVISEKTLSRIKSEYPKLYYLINFMLASACRISEALKICHKEITVIGHVKINTSKGGVIRITSAGNATEYMIQCKKNLVNPFDEFNRFHVHRQFKYYGINVRLKGRIKNTTTHLPRHLVAKSIKNAGMTMENSRQALGQKNINSTKYYHE